MTVFTLGQKAPTRYEITAAPIPVTMASVANAPNDPGCTKKSTSPVVIPNMTEIIHRILVRARKTLTAVMPPAIIPVSNATIKWPAVKAKILPWAIVITHAMVDSETYSMSGVTFLFMLFHTSLV